MLRYRITMILCGSVALWLCGAVGLQKESTILYSSTVGGRREREERKERKKGEVMKL